MLKRFREFLRRQRDDASRLEVAKQQMIERDLAGRGIQSERVLQAMANVPRERFLPPQLQLHAYSDRALPIDCQQTISQPYIVALMTELLDLEASHHVLEIGTGSGYQAAVLAELAHDVVTLERHAELAEKARLTLRALGCANVNCVVGDGSLGWPQGAPYDRILVTAAAERVPAALFDQLADNGKLVAPIGSLDQQQITVFHRRGDRFEQRAVTPCRFVPLIGQQGFADHEGGPAETSN